MYSLPSQEEFLVCILAQKIVESPDVEHNLGAPEAYEPSLKRYQPIEA